MRPAFLTTSLLLASALLVGCADSSGPTRPTEQTVPSFAGSGALVFRTNVGIAFGGDPSNPLAVLVGFAVGTTPADVCAGTFTFANSSSLIVLNPPGGFLAGDGTGHNVPVQVFQFGGGPLTSFCQLVGAPLVATGTASFDAPNLFTTGATVSDGTVRGTVELVSGGQARLFATLRFVVQPNGSLLFDNEQVTLTPL